MKIIGEIGSNWHTSDDAVRSVELAADCGFDAVKFQWFTSEDLYGPEITGASQQPPIEVLAYTANQCGIEFMCSAFSPAGVKYLDPYLLNHKVASAEMEYMELLDAVAATNKHFYISTGGHTLREVESVLKYLDLPTNRITLMYCESVYPVDKTDIFKLGMLAEFGYPVALSDHSTEVYSVPLLAKLNGATTIEKHVNLVGIENSPDAPHSLDVDNSRLMVKYLSDDYDPEDILSADEQPMRDVHNRRSTNGGFYRLP